MLTEMAVVRGQAARAGAAQARWAGPRGGLRLALVAALLLGGAGCSTRKIAYQLAPRFLLSWLDSKLDLSRAQKAALKPKLVEAFAWHRRSELPLYATRIDELRARLTHSLCEDDLRWFRATGEDLGGRTAEHVLPAAAELLASLTPAQVERVARLAGEDRAELTKKQAMPVEAWVREATDADVKSMKRWIGSVQPAQRKLLEDHQRRTRDDHFAAWQERTARMDELVARLRAGTGPAALAGITDELKRMGEASAHPTAPEAVARHARQEAEGNALMAAFHGLATPAQRKHLDEELVSWRDDFRELAAAQ